VFSYRKHVHKYLQMHNIYVNAMREQI
jgi:hypothetical protein